MPNDEDELMFETPLEEDVEDIGITEGKDQIFTDQGNPEIDSLYKK